MIRVTSHAVSRYRSRVAPVSEAEARQALASTAIAKAADFGAPFVKLATGQCIVLDGRTVVTVLPAETHPGTLHARRDPRMEGRRG